MLDFRNYEKGFYKVNYDGEWTVMYWDRTDWYDHVSGDYCYCDHRKWIKEVGEKIELPDS